MNEFVYTYPTVVYFGEGTAQKHLKNLVSNYGKTVMRAYGGGPVKKNGIYDEVKGLLMEAGKEVVDFPGIMLNPTYAKVQERAQLVRERHVEPLLALGGGSVMDCCKVISAGPRQLMRDEIYDLLIECL